MNAGLALVVGGAVVVALTPFNLLGLVLVIIGGLILLLPAVGR